MGQGINFMEYLNETWGYLSVYGCFNRASTPFGRIASRNGFKVHQAGRNHGTSLVS